VRYPNVYGIDMPAANELIAHGRTEQEIQSIIGADWLIYQELDDLIECAREGNDRVESFDCSVFDGQYPTGDITAEYLEKLEQERSDARKAYRNKELTADSDVIDMHNDE